jgi:hypothetical protein
MFFSIILHPLISFITFLKKTFTRHSNNSSIYCICYLINTYADNSSPAVVFCSRVAIWAPLQNNVVAFLKATMTEDFEIGTREVDRHRRLCRR